MNGPALLQCELNADILLATNQLGHMLLLMCTPLQRANPDLQEDSRRQMVFGFGIAVVFLGAAYFVSGYFWPSLFVFAGGIFVLRGLKPLLFAKETEAQIIAGTPYNRKRVLEILGCCCCYHLSIFREYFMGP